MKKAIGIVLTVIFFAIILGLFVFKLFFASNSDLPKTSQETINPFQEIEAVTQQIYSDTPYRLTVSCYAWYVRVRVRASSLEQIAVQPEALQCFTKNFIASWTSLQQSLESDPVVRAADIGSTWHGAIQAQPSGQSINAFDYLVTLGSGDDAHSVTAHLVREEDGVWRIDSVTP